MPDQRFVLLIICKDMHAACILHEYYIFNFIDIDECVRFNNGGCEHDCHNSNGSFSCTCRAGYTLKKDHLSCAGMLSIVKVI